MPKKVSDKQRQDFANSFLSGLKIDEIAELYKFSNQTIIRQLKIFFGDEKFLNMRENNQKNRKSATKNSKSIQMKSKKKNFKLKDKDLRTFIKNEDNRSNEFNRESFFEIIPETLVIDNDLQKDLSTEPISEYNFPHAVYMLVSKNIELEPKILKEYPHWSFLPEKDLQRLTLEIFSDQKSAKKLCKKDQKLIKIPNPKVFLIASKSLQSKGISRIIYEESLLAL